MNLGRRSFPLFRRCRGVVTADAANARQHFQVEAQELLPAGSGVCNGPLDPLHVLELAGGYATHQGGHVTRDSLLIDELSRYLDEPIEKNRLLRSFRLFRGLKKIDGTVLSLATPCQYNYYHWMLEALPKLALFRRYGQPGDGAFYYAELSKAFQTASFDLLGIAPAARIDSRQHQALQASSLWAATIPSPSGDPHPWAARWLREAFFQALPSSAEPIDCLVVSRRQARTRQIVNEDELVAALGPFSPTCVVLEECTLARQIDLFRRARLIVAPHGAGLTNIVFAQPEATVIELFGATYRNPCFEKLARVAGCGYRAIVNDDARAAASGELNMRIRVAEVVAACG
jgi:capsular polysaccharide biosynthesis protein